MLQDAQTQRGTAAEGGLSDSDRGSSVLDGTGDDIARSCCRSSSEMGLTAPSSSPHGRNSGEGLDCQGWGSGGSAGGGGRGRGSLSAKRWGGATRSAGVGGGAEGRRAK